MMDATPYAVPKEPGRWRAITLAATVHAALFAFLWFGVRWQNETPVAVEAEIWSPQPREAAPRPQPEPEPKPEIKPEPKPVIKETPKPQVIEPPIVRPDPEIAIAQEKKRKLLIEKKRQDQEREEERLEKKNKLAEQEAEKQEKLAEQKAKEKRIAQAEAEAAKKKAETDQAKKFAEEKKRKLQNEADAKFAEQRKENLARITNQAGAGGTGDAPKAQGGRADPGYTSRLSAKIKSNTTYIVPPDLGNNPAVEYTVELLPDGSVRSIKKLRPSGLSGFDEAVERAIRRSEPYPADKSGAVPSSFTFSHKPKDNQ
jgi:colicin import membrane protein